MAIQVINGFLVRLLGLDFTYAHMQLNQRQLDSFFLDSQCFTLYWERADVAWMEKKNESRCPKPLRITMTDNLNQHSLFFWHQIKPTHHFLKGTSPHMRMHQRSESVGVCVGCNLFLLSQGAFVYVTIPVLISYEGKFAAAIFHPCNQLKPVQGTSSSFLQVCSAMWHQQRWSELTEVWCPSWQTSKTQERRITEWLCKRQNKNKSCAVFAGLVLPEDLGWYVIIEAKYYLFNKTKGN